MGIRKYKKSVIAGCAAIAAALVVLPAAARTWHGMWNNEAETGALVATVDPDGPAAGAGVQRGDIIVQVDGTAIDNHRDFLAAIRGNGVDDILMLALRRGNESVSLNLTVGESDRGPYLGMLLVPGGVGAFRADTFGELQDRGPRGQRSERGRRGHDGFERRGMDRRGWLHGGPGEDRQKTRQQDTSASAGGSA